MNGAELKILFIKDKAYLTHNKPLTLFQAGLPDYAQTKGFNLPAHWVIKVIDYIESEKRIFCKILSYNTGETELNYHPKLLIELSEINIVSFRDIDTGGLFKTLLAKETSSSYVPSKPVSHERSRYQPQFEPVIKHARKKSIHEVFYIPLKNVRFVNGGVLFNVKPKEYGKPLEFRISNESIIAEFDSIKNYFSNVLGTKSIQVSALIELHNDEVVSIIAESPEIEKINTDIIEKVRYELVNKIIAANVDNNKNILTIEDCFMTLGDSTVNSKIFYNEDNKFLEDLLKVSDSKHYKHLRYLSSKHSHNKAKLRYVRNPFSFIFLIERDKNNYLVWETLDTEEATYIWQIDNDFHNIIAEFERLEIIVNKIKVEGKRVYLDSEKESLIRIFHDYSSDDDGFGIWKKKLEGVFT